MSLGEALGKNQVDVSLTIKNIVWNNVFDGFANLEGLIHLKYSPFLKDFPAQMEKSV